MKNGARHVENFPYHFGFEPDLRECVGKTIERVEMVEMEWGCTWQQAFAVRFTDGSRAFFGATVGTGIMNPRLEGPTYGNVKTVETSDIFTKREYAEMVSAKQADSARRAQDAEREERRRYQALAAKYGPSAALRSE